MSALDFERELYAFLSARTYDDELHWCGDGAVRDTGPFIDGAYYGTHPAVRVYYSPEVMTWLEGGRQGELPDGATIVKEMYPPPAARYEDVVADDLGAKISGWTVMIRRRDASQDGWFWGGASPGKPPDDSDPFPSENGFGLSCLRCHASAEKESTFSTLANIAGFDGEPLRFRVDNSWRDVAAQEKPWNDPHLFDYDDETHAQTTSPKLNEVFARTFPSIAPTAPKDVQHFPGQAHDTVVATHGELAPFMSSDQCMMCHAGLSAPPGPEMFLVTGPTDPKTYITPGFNVSPYGEWRRSPMGLAGRDPIFFSQLETELAILAKEFADDPEERDALSSNLVDTCLSCHGVMGQRQHKLDAGPDALFHTDWVFELPDDADERRWGALARDGISCLTCHRSRPITPPPGSDQPPIQYFLENGTTGRFRIGPPDEIYGPFEDIVTHPMKAALGIEPKADAYIKSSQMCGSCHTINLPNVDKPTAAGSDRVLDRIETNPVFKPYFHSIEQATYLEWLNSSYENEFNPDNPEARSCQDCHMPRGYSDIPTSTNIPQIQTRIASIQDDSYPQAEHSAPAEDLHVRFRSEGYARHELLGLNVFLLEMFRQFPDVLGVSPADYMTSSVSDQQHAIDNITRHFPQRTATLELSPPRIVEGADGEQRLVTDVTVTNLAGHRLPSGVSFRRLFLEFKVYEIWAAEPIFISGATNAAGVIVDAQGEPLPTEFFEGGSFQPHHAVISSDTQVQIYEELIHDAAGRFTTSFIHRDTEVKDNRLLPKGWKPDGQDPDVTPQIAEFIQATWPGEHAREDPAYADGSGTDVVRYEIPWPGDVNPREARVEATLYSQATPPYYLAQRFALAPDGPATRRLHALASHLDLDGTPMRDWKLHVTSATRMVEED